MHINTNIGASNIFQTKYASFLEQNISEQEIQALMRQLGYILNTGDKVFDVDQKKQCITIPQLSETDWEDIHIIWQTRRSKITDAIRYIAEHFSFISKDTVTNTLLDIVAYTNAYIKQTTKRGQVKLWSLRTKNMLYTIPQETNTISAKKQTQNEIGNVLIDERKNIPLNSLQELIDVINTSTFPLHINTKQNRLIIDGISAKKMTQLKCPKDYICRLDNKKYSLDQIILRCIIKWGNNIEKRNFIEKYISSDLQPKEKIELYTYICQNLIKLYYIYTKKYLILKYDNGNDIQHEWKGINISINFSEGKDDNTLISSKDSIHEGGKKVLHFSMKKRILKSDENDIKIFDIELINSLGYDNGYAKKLYKFVVQHILHKQIPDIINVINVASIRKHIHPSIIQNYHTDRINSYYIKSLDNILENYLVDKARSSNDNWLEVTATNRQ